MTATPLPRCGIWTTDMEGDLVMGFTPEQFLSVWQARADLRAENQRLREALDDIRVSTTDHDTMLKARAALESKP